MNNRLIKSNDTGGGVCTNTVDLYNPFPDGGGVALYQLNGNANDVSGNYNGTATSVTYGAGEFGQAGVFNGSSSYITLPVTQSNDISISAWIKIEDLTRQHQIVSYDLGGVSANRCLQFRVEFDQTVSAYWFSGTKAQSTSSVSQGVWTHVVATWEDNGTQKIYFNGQQEGSNAATTRPNFPNLYAGKRNTSVNADDFLGSIDQVRIFSRALRPYEVEALYTEEYCTPTIVPSEHFNTVTYTGDNTANRQITDVGFQPDLVWIKGRTIPSSHVLSDSVRGANLKLRSNSTAAEAGTDYGVVSAFSATGFSVDGTIDKGDVNNTGDNYVAWNFKAGGAAVTNTDGTITSQVSANTESGFSIVSYTGDYVSGDSQREVGHGLNLPPEVVIIKNRTNTSDWFFYTDIIDDSQDILYLNNTNAKANSSRPLPNSSIFYTGGATSLNILNNEYICYAFHSVEGFSNFGSYVGNGSTSGPTVVTGFEPAFVMVKRTDVAGGLWLMSDNKRQTDITKTTYLQAQSSAAEYSPYTWIEYLENGFQLKNTGSSLNASGASYIYMAFAADPTTIEPSLEDSFNTVTYTGNGGANAITGVGFEPQLSWIKVRNAVNHHFLVDDVRGNFYLRTNETTAETAVSGFNGFTSDGFDFSSGGTLYNGSGLNYVAWNWKGAEIPAINSNGSIPSVVSANPAAGFSIVSYTGNGVSGATIGHGLNDEPKIFIVKRRDLARSWHVLGSVVGLDKYLLLDTTDALGSASGYFSLPNNTTINYGTPSSAVNDSNGTYIAYCFAEVAGFSKFGSYVAQSYPNVSTVTTGFEPAFVMLKTTDITSNWYIYDNKRRDSNEYGYRLFPNLNNAESASAGYNLDFTSDGFTVQGTGVLSNSGNNVIYMAFANQF